MPNQLVRVVHSRCNEYSDTEYFLAPSAWSSIYINKLVDKVVDELIEDAKSVKEAPLNPPIHPKFEDYPDLTVGAVQELHQQAKSQYKEWLEENRQLTRSFADRLIEVGFRPLWNDDSLIEVIANWGHNHGLDLKYA